MEIKVGEYVRTEDGYIGKLVEYIPNALNYLKIDIGREIKHCDDSIDNFIYTRYGFQLKHSKNIIDLIEEGDYVNGYKVRGKTNEKVVVDYYCYSQELCDGQWLSFQKDLIKTIVTKEMYSNAEYRVETN